MQKLFIIMYIIIYFPSIIFAQEQNGYVVEINNLTVPLNNSGSLGLLWIGDSSYFGTFEEKSIFYTGGFALSGLHNSSIWSNAMLPSSRIEDFLPGKVGMNSDDEKNKLYIVKSSDPDFGLSWHEWKTAVELGAYFYDGNKDGVYAPVDINENGKWDIDEDMPDLMGDLTVWCVFNDSQTDSLRRTGSTTKGIEVKQTVFASASPNAGDLGNVVFIRYVIENTGTVSEEFDSTYFAFFLDHDIGDYIDDLSGCDTTLEIGFGYNSGSDELYGENPPCLILNPLLTPHVFKEGETFIDNNGNNYFDEGIDTAIDTAVIKRGNILGEKKIVGAATLNWSAFTPYVRATPSLWDPDTEEQLRYYMIGGKYKDGSNIDVSTMQLGNGSTLGSESDSISSKYIFSGNPIDRTGWLPADDFNGADFRMLLSYGPFTLRRGEPIEVMAAYIVGRGDDHLSSITEAKRINTIIDELYNNNFANIPVGIKDKPQTHLPTEYSLFQNYPNPFNPTTAIKYDLVEKSKVELRIYNILGQEVITLVNKLENKGSKTILWNGKDSFNKKVSSGIYFYRISAGDWSDIKKMILLK